MLLRPKNLGHSQEQGSCRRGRDKRSQPTSKQPMATGSELKPFRACYQLRGSDANGPSFITVPQELISDAPELSCTAKPIPAWERVDAGGWPGPAVSEQSSARLASEPSFPGPLPAEPSHLSHCRWFSLWKLLQEHRHPAGRQYFVATPTLCRGTSSLSWASPGFRSWNPSRISQESVCWGFCWFVSPLVPIIQNIH